ncbi:MAG: glycosyltransferase family 4 protein [Alphaproteobacteria bacterium]|nr:glycosyltransferase family 4 protein [Alphaproteobacteria bacterium]MBL0718080.1 glycosyltransferase family 4 protein [Alphaproteobacteria bacterium]
MVSKKNHICLVLPKLKQGGVETVAIELAKEISRNQSAEISIIANGGPLLHKIRQHNIKFKKIDVESKNVFSMIVSAIRIRVFCKKNRVDVIVPMSRIPAWIVLWATRRSDSKCIMFVHGFNNIPRSIYGKLKLIYNSVLVKSKPVFVVSNFLKHTIVSRYKKVDPQNVKVIYNGISLDKFNHELMKSARIEYCVDKYNIALDKPIVACFGRLTDWKAQDNLIKAVAQIKQKDFYCYIVGQDDHKNKYKDELVELVNQLGISDKVFFISHIDSDDIAIVMGLCNSVVSPSKSPETFGMTLLEAQAMGTPVIATAHGGPIEIIDENRSGVLVDPNNSVDEMACKLSYFLDMKKTEYKSFRQNAIKQASKFSIKSMSDTFVRYCKEAL